MAARILCLIVLLLEIRGLSISLTDRKWLVLIGGYIGFSTRTKIEYAKATGKTVRYIEPV